MALKDAQTRHQIGANAVQQGNGRCHVRKFEQIFAEELANHCAKNDSQEGKRSRSLAEQTAGSNTVASSSPQGVRRVPRTAL
jgi:hypothetical protein